MSVWLGGTFLSSNRWAWIDGHRPSGYTNWARGEPNNLGGSEGKMMMWGRGAPHGFLEGTWNDENHLNGKRYANGFICEHRA